MSANAVRKTSDECEENPMDLETAQVEEVAPAENDSKMEISFELGEPRWAVVTFESCAAKDLTYEQAFQKMQELKEQNVSGLCIVTNEAAERI
jgi:hypothetical protein